LDQKEGCESTFELTFQTSVAGIGRSHMYF
jgi:hypothetical protein